MYQKMNEYLSAGGLFNPELMEHDKVRNLVMDARDEILRLRELLDGLQSLADGVECMGITDPASGIRWAIAEIKRLRGENERLREAIKSGASELGGK